MHPFRSGALRPNGCIATQRVHRTSPRPQPRCTPKGQCASRALCLNDVVTPQPRAHAAAPGVRGVTPKPSSAKRPLTGRRSRAGPRRTQTLTRGPPPDADAHARAPMDTETPASSPGTRPGPTVLAQKRDEPSLSADGAVSSRLPIKGPRGRTGDARSRSTGYRWPSRRTACGSTTGHVHAARR